MGWAELGKLCSAMPAFYRARKIVLVAPLASAEL